MTNLTEEAHKDMDELANRFFAAIEREDIDAVEQAYAPDVEYRIKVTGESLGLEAILEMVRLFTPSARNIHDCVTRSRETAFLPSLRVNRRLRFSWRGDLCKLLSDE